MANEPNLEYQRIVQACDALESEAVAHEAKSGKKGAFCSDNRSFLAAMAITHLGLDIDDLGNIARHLHFMEMEDEDLAAEEEISNAADDAVLGATELRLVEAADGE